MQIIWLADYNLEDHPGGAQQTNAVMIREGKKRGHVIHQMKAENFDKEMIANSDLVVTNNITTFKESDLLFALSYTNVRYEHDYAVANRKILNGRPYIDSRTNIFLSPLHNKEVERIFGRDIKNVKFIPSPIDPEIFHPKGLNREVNSVLFAHQLCQEKGIVEFAGYIESQSDKTFTVCGWGDGVDMVRNYPNVDYQGVVDHTKLANLYNSHQFFYARPLWKEPFGRSVVEAYLCGCDLMVNENIGALSYDWDWSDYDLIKTKMLDAPTLFWETIENA